jgi:hypothetical protein
MRQPSPLAKFFWVISLLASVAGGAIGTFGFIAANGAPQEAAAAAFGCLIAIAPYVLARSVTALSSSDAPAAPREPVSAKAIVGVIVVLAGLAATVYLTNNWQQVVPASGYADFQASRDAWHRRCDPYIGRSVAAADRELAESCQREREQLQTEAKVNGWPPP